VAGSGAIWGYEQPLYKLSFQAVSGRCKELSRENEEREKVSSYSLLVSPCELCKIL